MNEEPDGNQTTTEEKKPPTLAGRLLRILLGGIAVYVITLFLTMFFWNGFPNPNGPALIASAAFVLFAAFLSISLTRK